MAHDVLMERRTALILAAATVVAPAIRLSANSTNEPPPPRGGETWETLAESMAGWERSANRDNFRSEWRNVRERQWIPWNHRRDDPVKSQDVSLVYLASPERNASKELLDAVGRLADGGIQLLGNAATNCNYIASAFVWANHRDVEAILSDWFINRPPHPREHWTEEEWAEAIELEQSLA